MCCRIYIVLSLIGVHCERYFTANNFEKYSEGLPKFLDVSTTHEDAYEILPSYHLVSEIPYRQSQRPLHLENENSMHDSSTVDRILPPHYEEMVYTDRLDFHYPKLEFVTKSENVKSDYNKPDSQHEDRFVFLQSQKVPANNLNNKKSHSNRRSRFKSQKFNRIQYQPVKLSYVQKVLKPENNIADNKYAQIDLSENSTELSNDNGSTRNSIDQILKTYLLKLYSQKYNTSKSSIVRHTKLYDENTLNDSAKSLGLEGISSKFKNKFSLFTIVQFNNTQCNATSSSGSYIGVCYTAAECNQIEGTAVGNCASGYGVCCVALGTCGGWASQNCSYFQSPNYPDYYPSGNGVIIPTTIAPPTTTTNPSPTPDPRLTWYFIRNELGRQSDTTMSCVFSVYKTNQNVNKMRIDFIDLELAGPTNGTCTVERLVISGQDVNSRVPAICGYNTGQHVYVDVTMLTGPLQLSVLSTMNYRKRFNIQICQYSDSCLEPTSSCLQYYTGVTGTVSSFNYDQASSFNRSVPGYFNDLNYAICIRREAGYCSITYTNVRNEDEYPFQLLNVDSSGDSTIPQGQAGVDVMDCPDDYIVIDGVRLCGDKFNDGSVNSNYTLNAPVTDTSAGPIVIPVRTDSDVTGVGFKLFYTQNRCPIN